VLSPAGIRHHSIDAGSSSLPRVADIGPSPFSFDERLTATRFRHPESPSARGKARVNYRASPRECRLLAKGILPVRLDCECRRTSGAQPRGDHTFKVDTTPRARQADANRFLKAFQANGA